jgi:pilus assembly protein CpaC
MKSIFKTIDSSEKLFELKLPESFYERLIGLNKFRTMPQDCGLTFKAPCTLHTIGMQSDIWIIELNENFQSLSEPQRVKPYSIILSGSNGKWISEFRTLPQIRLMPEDSKIEGNAVVFPLGCQIKSIVQTAFRIFTILILLYFTKFAYAAQKAMTLPVGESKEIRLDEAPRSLDISQPDVIDVQRIGTTNKILVTALRSGNSRLTAHFSDGRKLDWLFQAGVSGQVPDPSPSLSSASLLRLAREIQRRAGLDAVLDNGRIAIFGQVNNETQLNALADLCLGREECLPRYCATPEGVRVQGRFLRKFFSENGYEGIAVEPTVGGILVKGSVENDGHLEKINTILKSFVSRFQNNLKADGASDALIETQLTFFKMNMNQLTALGLTLEKKDKEQSIELIKGSLPAFISQIQAGPKIYMNFPDIYLNALAKKGVIRHIARPTVVTASGSKSEIHTGGELLFRSSGQNQKFYSQNYGLIASVQPKYNDNGRISQKIEIKLSTPQSNSNPNSLSGMDQNILNTEISTKPDEHILLTRIQQSVSGKSVIKIPILGHVPIIGELFKSRDLQSEEGELWITLRSRLEISTSPELPKTEPDNSEQQTRAHWLD